MSCGDHRLLSEHNFVLARVWILFLPFIAIAQEVAEAWFRMIFQIQ